MNEALIEHLRGWANQVAQRFGAPVYLVGSALSSEEPRDIDVRVVLPIEEFLGRYGFQDYCVDGWSASGWPETRRRLAADVGKLSSYASVVLKLNIDLQIMSDIMEMACHQDKPRLRLDDLPLGAAGLTSSGYLRRIGFGLRRVIAWVTRLLGAPHQQ